MNDLDKLNLEIKQLEDKRARLIKEKEDYELNKTIMVAVVDFENGIYKVRPNAERKNLDHKSFGYYNSGNNWIEIDKTNWTKYTKYLEDRKNVVIFMSKMIELKIKSWDSRADGIVELSDKHFNIHIQSNDEGYPKIGWDNSIGTSVRWIRKNTWTVSILEVEKIANWIEFCKIKDWKLEVKPDAMKFITSEVARIGELSLIAKKDDIEFDTILANGDLPRSFQKVGVKFAELSGTKCLIADEMGLGKTIQAILIAMRSGGRTLVIVPANLIENWIIECNKHMGINPRVFIGINPDKYDMQELILEKKNKMNLISYNSLANYDCTLDAHGNEMDKKFPWAKLIEMSKFDLIVIDEAHKIKNVESGRSQGVRSINVKDTKVVGLTGTPVLNRPMELWPFFNWIAPEKIPGQADFAYRYTDGKNGARNVPELRNILKTLMIRRLKKDVIKELPPIINEYAYSYLTADQLKGYNQIKAGIFIRLDASGKQTGQAFNVLNLLAEIIRLKQFCSSVKMDSVADYAKELYDEQDDDITHKKVIIFSQFKNTANGIHLRLGDESLYINGEVDMKERMRIVEEFQTNPRKKFLVGTTAISEGLNITAAGHVIISDLLWTPADHQQFIARAYGRLSDCHGVVVHWHIIKDTIEDWINELLMEKQMTADEVVDGVVNMNKTSSIAAEIFRRLRGK